MERIMLHYYENGVSEICCDKCMNQGVAKKATARCSYGYKYRKQDDLCGSCLQDLKDEEENIKITESYEVNK